MKGEITMKKTSCSRRLHACGFRSNARTRKGCGYITLLLIVPFLAHAKLNVVATTPEFGAIAKEVGGDKADVTTLAKPTEDPHFVDAKPSFIAKLNRADALIEGGAELEIGWLPPLL